MGLNLVKKQQRQFSDSDSLDAIYSFVSGLPWDDLEIEDFCRVHQIRSYTDEFGELVLPSTYMEIAQYLHVNPKEWRTFKFEHELVTDPDELTCPECRDTDIDRDFNYDTAHTIYTCRNCEHEFNEGTGGEGGLSTGSMEQPIGIISRSINENKMKLGKLKLLEILTPADIQLVKRMASDEAKSEARKVKDDVAKDITSLKQKQGDAEKLITKHTQDKDQHTTDKQVKDTIKTETDKLKQDTDKKIDDKITKAINGKDVDAKIRELVADTMVKYHQTLWVKRGFWTNGLTK